MLASRVDQKLIEQFKALGATQVGCMVFSKRNPYSGNVVEKPDSDVIYFFDERGVELGFCTVVSSFSTPHIFPPDGRRVWHQSFRDLLRFEPLCSG
jgi:hypothetical protein